MADFEATPEQPKSHTGFMVFIVLVVVVLLAGAFVLSQSNLLKGTVSVGSNKTITVEGNDSITASQAKARDALDKKYREALKNAHGQAEIKSIHESYVKDLIKLFEK